MDYPANNGSAKREPTPQRERVQRVTRSEAIQRKKPLGRRFSETFFGGDARSAGSYVVLDVLLPASKDMVVDAITQMAERIFFGEARARGRRSYTPGGGLLGGITQYNSAFRADPRDAGISRRSRGGPGLEEIVLPTRSEAQHVVDELYKLCEKYGQATVTDLCDLVGVTAAYTDDKWGWTELRGADVRRVREGYLIDLPRSEAL